MKIIRWLVFAALGAIVLIPLIAGCGGESTDASTSSRSDEANVTTQVSDTSQMSATTTASKTSNSSVYTLVYSSWQSPESNFYKEVELSLANNLETLSNGRIKVQMYSGGTLASQPEALNAVLSGTADIAAAAPGVYGGKFPMSALLDVPGLGFTSSQMAGEIYKKFIELYAQDEYSQLKVVPFSTGPMGISLKKPITKLSETKNVQVRTGASLVDALTALGFTPTDLSMGELYEGLRLNLVQGAVSSAEAIGVFKLNEVTDYYLETPFFSACQFIIMNKEKYDSLPVDLQAVVDQALEQTYQTALTYNDRVGAGVLKATGMQVIHVTDQDAWQEVLRPLAARYAKTLDDQGHKGTEALQWLLNQIAQQ